MSSGIRQHYCHVIVIIPLITTNIITIATIIIIRFTTLCDNNDNENDNNNNDNKNAYYPDTVVKQSQWQAVLLPNIPTRMVIWQLCIVYLFTRREIGERKWGLLVIIITIRLFIDSVAPGEHLTPGRRRSVAPTCPNTPAPRPACIVWRPTCFQSVCLSWDPRVIRYFPD